MICFILSSLSILGAIEGTSTIDFLPKTILAQNVAQTACTQTSSIIKRQPKGPENSNRSVLNQRTGLTTQSQRSMSFSPYKLFKMIGCAFLVQGIQANKTMYHPCPAPLKIYEPQHPTAANFFNRCINRVCQRYACPSELPPGMRPIAESACPRKICVLHNRSWHKHRELYEEPLTSKEQQVVKRLARREKRCWYRTCARHGRFFSPALVIPNNITATQQLNECFAPVCKMFSTNKCINGQRLWNDQPSSNTVQLIYSLFKNVCDETLCPSRYVEKYSFAMREPTITVVNKFLKYCKQYYDRYTNQTP